MLFKAVGNVICNELSIIHDGVEFGNVLPQRGIRLSDHISPYLYILCAEGLNSMIRRNEEA